MRLLTMYLAFLLSIFALTTGAYALESAAPTSCEVWEEQTEELLDQTFAALGVSIEALTRATIIANTVAPPTQTADLIDTWGELYAKWHLIDVPPHYLVLSLAMEDLSRTMWIVWTQVETGTIQPEDIAAATKAIERANSVYADAVIADFTMALTPTPSDAPSKCQDAVATWVAASPSIDVPTPFPAATRMPRPTREPSPGSIEIVSKDILFAPDEVTIAAETDVTVTLPNEGAAPHNFSIDELDIDVDIEPGAFEEVVINAAPGEYEFYCNVPGHREAGMVGTLTVE